MRFGIHMPQKGGFDSNVRRAAAIGCQTVQIFPGNPTAWRPPRLDPPAIEQRRRLLREYAIRPLVLHAAYLINLASPNTDFFNRSIVLLKDTLTRASLYGAPFVVLHTGNHGGQGVQAGLATIVAALGELMPDWPEGVMLLLENMAGGGSALGGRFEEIGFILDCFPPEAPLGLCLDTAHAWGAGYDLTSARGVDELLDEIARHIGRERLKVIHANDSASARGAKVDRHAHIGAGKIGLRGFELLLQREWRPPPAVILETPEIGSPHDRENLEKIRRCAAR